MKILTGNDLKTGAVIWWDGNDWSLHVNAAADVGDQGEAVAARESADRRVVSAYMIDAVKRMACARRISRTGFARWGLPSAWTCRSSLRMPMSAIG